MSFNVKETLLTEALNHFSFSRLAPTINPLTRTRENLCVVKRNLLSFNRILYEWKISRYFKTFRGQCQSYLVVNSGKLISASVKFHYFL